MKFKVSTIRTVFIIFVLLSGTISSQLNSQCTNIHPDDLAALQDLYRDTDGDHWTDNTGWDQIMNTTPPAICDLTTIHGLIFSGDRVAYIQLNSNNLNGSIPESIGEMLNLLQIDFQLNNLHGSIPRALGRLNNLTFLRLAFNNLTGRIPGVLGNLSLLGVLNLGYNNLSGPIPRTLGRLSNLYRLGLADNNLTGRIPRELSRISNLEELYLQLNRLTGPVPLEFGNLSQLRNLQLYSNELKGTIPHSLGRLTNLEVLHMASNNFRGTIPSSLGNLNSLVFMYLNHNKLSGIIPPRIGQLNLLEVLDLSRNMLSGNIPGELGNLSGLMVMYLFSNDLSGCFHPNLRHLCSADVRLDDVEFIVPWEDFCKGLGGECECRDTVTYFPELCILPREKVAEFGLATADCRVTNYALTDADGNPLPDTLYAQNGDFCEPVLLTYTCEDGTTCVIQIEISSDFSSPRFVSMTMQEYLSGATIFNVRGCPGIYRYEDEALFHSCELTRIKRTWRYTDVCGNTKAGIQFIDIQDFFFCRFVGPFSLPEGIPSRIRVEIPPNIDIRDIDFEWSVRSRDWKVLGQKGPELLVSPGQSRAKVHVQITFPTGLELRVRGIFKSYKPTSNDNRLIYEKEASGNDIITVYPNPVNSMVNVRIPEHEKASSVQIIDRLGRVVMHEKIQSQYFSIPVDDLVPGIYFLRLSDGSKVISRRFIKQ